MLECGLCDLSRPSASALIDAFATEPDHRYAERYKGARHDQTLAGRALVRAMLAEFVGVNPQATSRRSVPHGDEI